MGAGGGLFVNTGTNVTLTNVSFTGAAAVGGSGGRGAYDGSGGGGGGMGGAGGSSHVAYSGRTFGSQAGGSGGGGSPCSRPHLICSERYADGVIPVCRAKTWVKRL